MQAVYKHVLVFKNLTLHFQSDLQTVFSFDHQITTKSQGLLFQICFIMCKKKQCKKLVSEACQWSLSVKIVSFSVEFSMLKMFIVSEWEKTMSKLYKPSITWKIKCVCVGSWIMNSIHNPEIRTNLIIDRNFQKFQTIYTFKSDYNEAWNRNLNYAFWNYR